ncbi:S-adenosyl-L-methionine-dependent methyltransferase [Apiospora arundinis]|uniref:S-adenosyl-L-methionine-dependent methyltransferase n=1 Tax=Apiospora arundinis TaxID=335852 RepID=A0ABR2JHB8_9PEZI
MNAPEGVVNFVPKQAVAPTPQLYDELVSDSMENLAKASLSLAEAIPNGAVINDNGCGTGAGTAAILDAVAGKSGISITVKGNDINDDALAVYRKRAAEHKWPAEGVHADSNELRFGDCTFDLAIGNALLFLLPDDGIGAVKEVHRTLKPGGLAFFNSWKYVPNMPVLEAAAKATRPEGTPLPRAGLEKWASAGFLQSVVEKGGFQSDRISMHEVPVSVTTSEPNRYANMLWSFIGGTTPVGWLKSDEENWDKAIDIIKEELKKTKDYKEIEGNRLQLQFVANIAVAKK